MMEALRRIAAGDTGSRPLDEQFAEDDRYDASVERDRRVGTRRTRPLGSSAASTTDDRAAREAERKRASALRQAATDERVSRARPDRVKVEAAADALDREWEEDEDD